MKGIRTLSEGTMKTLIVFMFLFLTGCNPSAWNSFLKGFSEGLNSRTPTTSDVIESRIDGDFEGWDGETIFKLENGQIWQQKSYSYTYHYKYRPKVIIYYSDGEYILKVEDVDKTISVVRLK